jgi:hypothetical protein
VEKVELVCRYGELTTDIEYEVVEDGYDYMRLRHHGRCIYVPKTLIKSCQPLRRTRQYLPTYEEILEEEAALFA